MTLSALTETDRDEQQALKMKRDAQDPPPPRRTKARSECNSSGNGDMSSDDEEWEKINSPVNATDDRPVVDPMSDASMSNTASEDPEDAPPGVGLKIEAEPDGGAITSVQLAFKAKCPAKAEHRAVGYAAMDTSASMSLNGGAKGLLDVVANFGDMARNLPPDGVPISLGAYTFDTACAFPEGALSGANTASYPIDKWDHSESPGMIPTFASVVGSSIHARGEGTNLDLAVRTGLDHIVDRLLSLPSLAERQKTIGMLLLCTDGIPKGGESDANVIRKIVDDRMEQTGLCICVASIALGYDPNPNWLRTLCGKTGVCSWARDPRDSAEAFATALGCVSNSKGIFYATWGVSRLHSATGERENVLTGTKHFGLITSKNVLAKFAIPAPPGGFLYGDAINVTFGDKSYDFVIDTATTTLRADIFGEVDADEELQTTMENLPNDVYGALAAVEVLSAKTQQRTASRAVRAKADFFSQKVMRSLSVPEARSDGFAIQEDDDKFQYRSLGCSLPTPVRVSRAPTEHIACEAASQSCYD